MRSSQARLLARLAASVGFAVGLALTSAAQAQDRTFELKLSHWVPPAHPLQKAMEEWGASVEKASNGTIKYKVFPAQQLGKAFDHYDMARDGIADLTYVNPGYQPGRFPIIAAGVTLLGGTNVQASAPEVRDVLEKGVADALTFPWGSVPLFGVDKVTKYHMEVPLYV